MFVSFLYWPNSHCDSLEHVQNWVHAIRCLFLETYSLSESNAGHPDGSSITIGVAERRTQETSQTFDKLGLWNISCIFTWFGGKNARFSQMRVFHNRGGSAGFRIQMRVWPAWCGSLGVYVFLSSIQLTAQCWWVRNKNTFCSGLLTTMSFFPVFWRQSNFKIIIKKTKQTSSCVFTKLYSTIKLWDKIINLIYHRHCLV